MNPSWRLDTIDPRAGRAFASRRDQNVNVLSGIGEDVLCAFISPPSFNPEFVGNRSVALGLARGSGQIGLFREKGEISFDTLGAIAEFVRRVYLRGAAGDGPAEGGGSFPKGRDDDAPPPPFSPVEADPDHSGNDFVKDVIGLADGNYERSNKLPENVSTKACALETKVGATSARRLARGAARSLAEALRRAPTSETAPEYEQWLAIVGRILGIVRHMQLWPLVHFEIAEPHLRDWFLNQGSLGKMIWHTIVDNRPDYWIYWHWMWPGFPLTSDPFADLAQVPLPSSIGNFDVSGSRTLQTLLSALIATPSDVLASKLPQQDRETRSELILFAAACLNSGIDMPAILVNGPFPPTRYPIFYKPLLSKTLHWLSHNLPKVVFDQDVERLICSASELGPNAKPIP
jgi:hypothetical protein